MGAAAAADAWADYWVRSARGAIDIDAVDDPVAAALRSHWITQTAWLSACSVVLDVGSGPAVLARMFERAVVPTMAAVGWLCIDRARLPPATLPPRTRLLADIDFGSSRPDAQAPVDAIVSNFGLEYVDAGAAALACARWLPSGGRLHAVVHARGSIIDQASRQTAEDLRWVLDDVGLVERTGVLLDAIDTLPSEPGERMLHGVERRDAYNRAVNEVKQRMERRRAVSPALLETLQEATRIVQQALAGDPAGARSALTQRNQAMAAECARVQDMQAAACDAAALRTLVESLRQAGFEQLSIEPLDSPLGRVAAVVDARLSSRSDR